MEAVTKIHLLDTKITVQDALRSEESWPSRPSRVQTVRDGRVASMPADAKR